MADARALAVLAEKTKYTGEASPRLQAVAKLISGGMEVEAAMAAVKPPYGAKFIDGHAHNFPGVLASMGLLTETKAARLIRPAPPAQAPAVDREVIR